MNNAEILTELNLLRENMGRIQRLLRHEGHWNHVLAVAEKSLRCNRRLRDVVANSVVISPPPYGADGMEHGMMMLSGYLEQIHSAAWMGDNLSRSHVADLTKRASGRIGSLSHFFSVSEAANFPNVALVKASDPPVGGFTPDMEL